MRFDKIWFDNSIRPLLDGWNIKEGTFHDDENIEYLNRIEIKKEDVGSDIEFYSSGMLEISVYNFKTGEELMNVAINSYALEEKKVTFNKLLELLGITPTSG